MMGAMARFLSEEWFGLVRAALAGPDSHSGDGARDTGAGTGTVTVHHRVTGTPDGDVEYLVRLGPGQGHVEQGAAGPADVEIVADYESAAAISQGVLTPADAFGAGRIKLVGDVGLLARHHDRFAALGELLADVRRSTTY